MKTPTVPAQLLKLPPSVGPVPGAFWRPNALFIRELAAHLRGARVLEVFAGNGFLAAWLAQAGVRVQATSRRSGHDAHEAGFYHPVEQIDAATAVAKHQDQSDVLLICWPVVTEDVLKAARLWGERPIVYIGEVTDYRKGHLGGCASDAFFEAIEHGHRFESYRGNPLEMAMVCKLRNA